MLDGEEPFGSVTWPVATRAGTERRGAFKREPNVAVPSRCVVFGADRGDAAGRDVDIQRATERSERATDDQEEELTVWCLK